MLVIVKPDKSDKYAKCICCGSTVCLNEYRFGIKSCIKTSIMLCSNCVTNMYKESQKEVDDGTETS